MIRKGFMLFVVLLFSVFITTACGSDEKEEKDDTANAEKSKEEVVKKDEDNKAKEPKNTKEASFSELISYMEKTTEGTADVLYENKEPQTHDMEGVTFTLNSYTLVELNDFHRDYNIPFDDQTNGGVIIAHYSVKNDTDKDVHYMPSLYMTYTGAEKDINNYQELLPKDQQLPILLSPDNDYLLEAGEEVSGYYTYPFGEDRLNDVLEVGSVEVEIPLPQTDKDDFSTSFGEEKTFSFPLDAENQKKAAQEASEGFYEDKVTAENMGDKEMLESEEGIGESKDIDKATVTLEGYQITNFVPNEEEAPRFQADELVLLTVKFTIDNGYDEDISKSSISSTLHLNDGKQWTLNEGMLLPYKNDDVISANDSSDLLQVFLLDKEQYEKIWKDKAFELEIGPMRNIDGKDISKGAEAEFKLK
ncbi:hypothetical protein J32TS6_08720 [Virgibacillus pantothenticus]|uniref:DUF5068 domain-containing protein n=1 Tax=Virgibacillus pantothenticus TaxID=1473 RepID=A0A0L0QN17_VIRPA|nr:MULTISPECIES: DUF5068 domain-containing protein [Virgibacillus]API93679.1 hypothetical protein BKP57_18790 [Virgibacillus sp. 6R]KNE19966.1 hypothetical protein AFK71_16305 [Virgibacillus pantothenticus]MBS7429919.1 DUF5068 domain-containing protein [Virgibacillus sp. 19R1-5]MBU8564982.1 DUF5068 domain-containing protein [Virgibacillus pantothenticus]MBU8599290.1 DUF5068 domain-containing protein [Virgibacillus pantothenticus]